MDASIQDAIRCRLGSRLAGLLLSSVLAACSSQASDQAASFDAPAAEQALLREVERQTAAVTALEAEIRAIPDASAAEGTSACYDKLMPAVHALAASDQMADETRHGGPPTACSDPEGERCRGDSLAWARSVTEAYARKAEELTAALRACRT